jgi:hypothetical protein
VQAEINLAKNAGMENEIISKILHFDIDDFPPEIISTAQLAKSVTSERIDNPEARNIIQDT